MSCSKCGQPDSGVVAAQRRGVVRGPGCVVTLHGEITSIQPPWCILLGTAVLTTMTVTKRKQQRILKTILDAVRDALIAEIASDAARNGLRPTPTAKRLSKLERAVLRAIANDLTAQEIAQRVRLSEAGVKFYKQRLKKKLGVAGVAGMVRWAIRNGVIEA